MTVAANIAFVVGCPRSGTTWLQKMLGAHPDVATGTESDLFSYYLSHLLDRWEHQKQPTGRGVMGLPTYMTEEVFIGLVRQFAEAIVEEMRGDKPCMVEKTPQHVLHLRQIRRIFPDARIVHLVRDPRDVCLSIVKASRSWSSIGAPTVSKAVRVWKRHVRAAERAEASLPAADFMTLHYTDLYRDAAGEMARVLEFIGLKTDPADLERMIWSNTISHAKQHIDFPLRLRGEFDATASEPPQFINAGGTGAWRREFRWHQRLLLTFLLLREKKYFSSQTGSE